MLKNKIVTDRKLQAKYYKIDPFLFRTTYLLIPMILLLITGFTWNSDEESLAASQAGQPRGDCPYLNNLDFVHASPRLSPLQEFLPRNTSNYISVREDA